jgi:hypothetical protein
VEDIQEQEDDVEHDGNEEEETVSNDDMEHRVTIVAPQQQQRRGIQAFVGITIIMYRVMVIFD